MEFIEETLRGCAEDLTAQPEIRYSGRVYEVDIDGSEYEVTITLTRKGAPNFHQLYMKE